MKKMFSAQTSGLRKILIFALLSIAVIVLAGVLGRHSGQKGVKAATNEDRISYIQSLGWECDPNPAEEKRILLPEEFPEVLINYNALQLQQGFDLTKYAGKEIGMFTYTLLNYPVDDEVLCTLYLYKNRIIGGDIHSTAFTGFMRGLHTIEEAVK